MLYTIYYKGNTYRVHGEEKKREVMQKITANDRYMEYHQTVYCKINEYETDIYIYEMGYYKWQDHVKDMDTIKHLYDRLFCIMRKLKKLQAFSYDEWKEMVRQKAELEKELFYHNMAERWTEKERAEVHHKEYTLQVLRELL